MKLKIILTKISLVFALLVCTFSAALLLYFIVFQKKIKSGSMSLIPNIISLFKQDKGNLVSLPAGEIDYPLPARLKISRINVDSAIEHVDLTPEGEMGVPKGRDNVAWFKLSPPPGEVGSSVIDGHSGYKNNKPAVFDNLHKLKKGDKIYVEDSKGVTTVFLVRKLRSYGFNEVASDVFASNDRKSHLNLVTCAGDWNAKEKTHSKRLVVFTDKE